MSTMNNVKTLNSAVRTMMLLAFSGALGYGGWFGYKEYVKPGLDAKQAIAELDQLKSDFSQQTVQMQQLKSDFSQQTVQLQQVEQANEKLNLLNDRLETSLGLLKVDRRIANIKVMEKGTADDGQDFMEVRFSEIDEQGQLIGSPRDFTLQGHKFYVDGWVATFEDKYVENADELRAASLFVFKSIYGDAEAPKDGQRLDTQTVSNEPPGIYQNQRKTEFSRQIWGDFWSVCNDPLKQKELGIRTSHGQATYLEAEEGKTYQINIRASGSMSLLPISDQPAEP